MADPTIDPHSEIPALANRLSPEAIAALAIAGAPQPAPKLVIAAALPPAPDQEPDGLSSEEVRDEIARLIGPGVGGYTVEVGILKWGPFGTADEAAQWAIDSLPSLFSLPLASIEWLIRPLLKAGVPETASH